MKIIGYVRVSTDEQAREGVSLAAQEARIRAWAAYQGHEVEAVLVDEGKSGGSMHNRPNLQQALNSAVALGGAGMFVIYSFSRMSRSVKDAIAIAERLKAAGSEFVSLNEQIDTSTPFGKAFYVIISVFAELERDLIVQRTQTAMDQKRADGELLGNAPFGWRYERGEDGKPVPDAKLLMDDREQHGLELIAKAIEEEGRLNYAELARQLDAAGIPPRFQYVPDPNRPGKRQRLAANGGGWDRGVVRRIANAVRRQREACITARLEHAESENHNVVAKIG